MVRLASEIDLPSLANGCRWFLGTVGKSMMAGLALGNLSIRDVLFGASSFSKSDPLRFTKKWVHSVFYGVMQGKFFLNGCYEIPAPFSSSRSSPLSVDQGDPHSRAFHEKLSGVSFPFGGARD
ncbi:hypothetical protein MPNT_20010 [Candidatus Methylacidithermus pantelleriae]|uniref:Uncharacterized protein n=1 Tax=Candidatus Methylacidithermus pantelleriae TaxID=2744239 RepID=A0A8J2BP48_9BACT|nr:hypothetical protein MPNT_20010 [Candidatus Methylacidithermus pantelleriae]